MDVVGAPDTALMSLVQAIVRGEADIASQLLTASPALAVASFHQGAGRPQSNFLLNITLEEHTRRLERLGLPVPQIESDLVDEELSEVK